MNDGAIEQFVHTCDEGEVGEAQKLLTDRLMSDLLALLVDAGVITRGGAENLIRSSALEVVREVPHLKVPVWLLAEISIGRLPR